MTNNNNISNNKKKLWNTKFTQLFSSHHLRVPIMGAPMAGVSGGKLAAAACRAGAMGFIAAGHFNNEVTWNEKFKSFVKILHRIIIRKYHQVLLYWQLVLLVIPFVRNSLNKYYKGIDRMSCNYC